VVGRCSFDLDGAGLDSIAVPTAVVPGANDDQRRGNDRPRGDVDGSRRSDWNDGASVHETNQKRGSEQIFHESLHE
jgi:hypothetical protein